MKQSIPLIASALLCIIAILFIASSYPTELRSNGATSYHYFSNSSDVVCTLNDSEIRLTIPTQKTTTVWNPTFNIYKIPDIALKLTFFVSITVSRANDEEKMWTWSYTFYNSTQLPVTKTVPLNVYLDNSDFDLSVGETMAQIKLKSEINVINSTGDSVPTWGNADWNTYYGTLINENPLIAFFNINSFAIGTILLSIGVGVAITATAYHAVTRKKANTKHPSSSDKLDQPQSSET